MENYVTDKHVGAGNYGDVVMVTHKKSGQVYVCKKVSLASKSPAQQKESENEVRTMSKVQHPHIVGFIEAFVEKKVLHIIMEYADGGDLEKMLTEAAKNKQPLAEQRIVEIFVQMALALRQLHKQHLLHRDLKSANVYLTSGGKVKLGDFGFSKQLNYTVALASTVCGTPYYFSPELCQKLPYNNKSDVWSLGVILYELINLRKPVEARSIGELRKRVVTEPPAPFTAEHVSPALAELCLRLLRKSPSSRPSVSEVLVTPVVRAHLATLSARLAAQCDEAKDGAERALRVHAPGAAGAAPAVPRANHQFSSLLNPEEVTSTGQGASEVAPRREKFNPKDVRAMLGTANTVEPAPAAPAVYLHSDPNLIDARSRVAGDAPSSAVAALAGCLREQRAAGDLSRDVADVLSTGDVVDVEVVDIGESATDDEKVLREQLGEALFVRALELMLDVNACSGTPEAEAKSAELLRLLGDKSYLLNELKRVSADFELGE